MSDPELVAEVAARIRRAVNAKTVDIRPCVCGGQVRADRWAPTHGVRAHQRSRLHQAWRAYNEAVGKTDEQAGCGPGTSHPGPARSLIRSRIDD